MIWTKTDAGRIEMTARTRVKERAQRNLLLVRPALAEAVPPGHAVVAELVGGQEAEERDAEVQTAHGQLPPGQGRVRYEGVL